MAARAGDGRARRVVVPAAVAVVAAGLAAAVWVGRGADDDELPADAVSQGVVGAVDDESRAGGPLERSPANGYQLPRSRRPVQDFTDAFQVLTVAGDAPITLLGVESFGADDGGRTSMRLLDARLAGPGRTDDFQFLPRLGRLPEALGPLEDLEGATIGETRTSRERGHTLVLSYRVDGTEPTVRAGLRVHYESQGVRFVQDLPARIVSCGDLRQRECDELRERLFPDG